MKVLIAVTATGKYTQFLVDLIGSCESNLFVKHEKYYLLFVNDQDDPELGKLGLQLGPRLIIHKIYHLGFPGDTLYKFNRLVEARHEISVLEPDWIYIIDADMKIIGRIGDEFAPTDEKPIVSVLHPGWPRSDGTPERNRLSRAYIDPYISKKRLAYWCGGISGGTRKAYMKMAETIAAAVDEDDAHEIIALWHDESHMNRFYQDNKELLRIMPPNYCYPEDISSEKMKERWARPIIPKIIALAKNHIEVRAPDKPGMSHVLMGGLGNQLFQACTVLAAAWDQDFEPIFPLFCDHAQSRKKSYRSSVFRNLRRAKIDDIAFSNFPGASGIIEKIPVETCRDCVFKDPFDGKYNVTGRFQYDPIPTFWRRQNVMFRGYFQAWRYFEHWRDRLIQMLVPPDYDTYVSELMETIRAETDNPDGPVVGIHVRRGDYLKVPDYHYNLPDQWFYEAAQEIKYHLWERWNGRSAEIDEFGRCKGTLSITADRRKTITYVFFSDDIEHCKNCLGFQGLDRKLDDFQESRTYFVEFDYDMHFADTDVCDMLLMSKCDHFAISNSTFSAWAAWLSDNGDKIVIAPSMWFGPKLEEKGFTSADILDTDWIQLYVPDQEEIDNPIIEL